VTTASGRSPVVITLSSPLEQNQQAGVTRKGDARLEHIQALHGHVQKMRREMTTRRAARTVVASVLLCSNGNDGSHSGDYWLCLALMEHRQDRLSRRALASIVIAAAIPTVDATSLVVAVPAMARELNAGWQAQQWLLNTSTLALAALLLPAGLIGDRYGRRRALRLGLALSVAGALVGAAASTAWVLVFARTAMGAGGALLLPATIALVRSGTRADESRTQGFGQLAAWVGFGSAMAPLLAGALIDAASWRAIFVLPAAPAAIALVLSAGIAEQRSEEAPSRQLAGGALAGGLALAAATYAAIDGAAMGFTPARTGIAVGVSLVAAVGAWRLLRGLPQLRTASRNWAGGNGLTFAFYFGLIGFTYLLTTYAQEFAGWSATRAALVTLPTTLATWLLSSSLGGMAHRFGTRMVMIAATVTGGLGVLWAASAVQDAWSGWALAPGAALLGVALAFAAAPLTQAAVTSVSKPQAGIASAANHAVVRIAGLAATIGLGAVASGGASQFTPERLRTALLIIAAIVGLGGLAGTGLLKNNEAGGVKGDAEPEAQR
jgi:MFS family permease